MSLLTKQQETHRLRKQTYSCWGEGIVGDFGKTMYTLQYSKWITNKDLLYSTWNSAQCYVPMWMGGEFEGECIHVYPTAKSLHCSPESITTLLIVYTPIQNVFGVQK